jgi:hypothetical protein
MPHSSARVAEGCLRRWDGMRRPMTLLQARRTSSAQRRAARGRRAKQNDAIRLCGLDDAANHIGQGPLVWTAPISITPFGRIPHTLSQLKKRYFSAFAHPSLSHSPQLSAEGNRKPINPAVKGVGRRKARRSVRAKHRNPHYNLSHAVNIRPPFACKGIWTPP